MLGAFKKIEVMNIVGENILFNLLQVNELEKNYNFVEYYLHYFVVVRIIDKSDIYTNNN